MLQKLCSWILYKRWGWTKKVTIVHPEKYIICLAPHTSNWDFVLGQLYMRSEGMHINFLMKKEWFRGPLGWLFRRIGGIPVWRSKHSSMTDNLANTARNEKQFHLCVTPEGTRSPNANWKKGFYFIALKAGIPILLYGIDYQRRLIECSRLFIPTGDVEKDIHDIKDYYREFKGKYPENFLLDE